jgi:hypothetical protein
METQSANNQSESDRIAQEHAYRIRDMRKKQQEELDALNEKHQRDMLGLDKAYQVELTARKDEYDNKLTELQDSQTTRFSQITKQGEINTKQAQETYRIQAEELAARNEKKLSALREQEQLAEDNIHRHKDRGNA